MKHINILLVVIISIVFLGCGSSPVVRLQVQRVPEIVIPNAQTIKIERFNISSSNYRADIVSIHDLDLKAALFKNNTYKVVSNGSADIILGGTLNYISDDEVSTSSREDKDGRVTTTYTAYRTGKLQVRVNVTDGTGKMVGTSNFEVVEKSKASESSHYRAYENLRSRYDMLTRALKKSVPSIVRRITPYTENVRRVFAEVDDDKQIEAANKLAIAGDWNGAYNGWVIAESGSIDSQAASYFNQSIYFEKMGNLDKASEYAEKALNTKYDKRFNSRKLLLSKLMLDKKSLESSFGSPQGK